MKFAITFVLIIITFAILAGSYAKRMTITLEDDNMNIVKLSFFAFNEGDWPAFTDLHSPAYVQHAPDSLDPICWSKYILSCSVAHTRFPDLQFRVEDIFAVDDKVAVRTSWQYRNDSDQFKQHFPDGVVQGSEICIFKIKDGKIIEEWYGCNPVIIQRLVRIANSISSNK